MLRNKNAIECWNILKYEIESIVEQFVTLNKQGNGLDTITCQKKLLEKTAYKQTLWRVDMRTRKDEDYTNYKEALNVATTRRHSWKYNITSL